MGTPGNLTFFFFFFFFFFTKKKRYDEEHDAVCRFLRKVMRPPTVVSYRGASCILRPDLKNVFKKYKSGEVGKWHIFFGPCRGLEYCIVLSCNVMSCIFVVKMKMTMKMKMKMKNA